MPETGLVMPVAEIRAALGSIAREAGTIREDALALAGEGLISEMQFDAPVKTGVLKDSHGVEPTRGGVTMYANTDYALARHEVYPDKPGHQWAAKVMASRSVSILTGALREAVRRSTIGGGP